MIVLLLLILLVEVQTALLVAMEAVLKMMGIVF